MTTPLLVPLTRQPRQHIGHKAELLRFLLTKGFRIPSTHICVWDAYQGYRAGDATVPDQLRAELVQKLDDSLHYAVRSSANVEDGAQLSFAGQFQSVLDVSGPDNLLAAIETVWESAHSTTIQAYLDSTHAETDSLNMAVLLQAMVTPVVSGVVFTKNPLTGLDEVIVEAVPGSGEALLQGGAQPSRWVYKWGAWLTRPSEDPLPLAIIADVVKEAQAIARLYGRPVDLEWVYDGHQVTWVQMRPITSLNDVTFYSNRIAKEVLPGLIKPLVWSVNVPLVNGAWVRLFSELIGPNNIEPMSLSKSFYGRAYFNMGTLGDVFELLGLPRETLELMMGLEQPGSERPSFKPTRSTLRHVPRMVRFAFDKWRFERVISATLPDLKARYAAFQTDEIAHLDARALLKTIDRLFALTQEAAYFNIIIPLLMQIYHAVFNQQLLRLDVDPATFDLTADFEQLKALDPSTHLQQLYQLYQSLPAEIQEAILAENFSTFEARTDIGAFQRGVADFLDEFGHLSDSGNDFSVAPWREHPDLLLNMIARFDTGSTRQQKTSDLADLAVPWWQRWLYALFFRRARQFQFYREQISSLYTYGYGLFRRYFLALGAHLARLHHIAVPEDIFFLDLGEIRDLVCQPAGQASLLDTIAQRKADLVEYQTITPPETVFGDTPAPLEQQVGQQLVGVPTSRGYFRGKVCTVQGIEDFDKLAVGDVLVIPYSDVGWTPLFARAGAVVSESGGMLSHSSIVARELNIPAIVSVPHACQLQDGTIVSVDGFKGVLFLEQELI